MRPTEVLAPDTGAYRLTKAFLVYDNNRGSVYASVHEVEKGQLEPGRPATRTALRELATSVMQSTALGGWLSPHTIYLSDGIVVWHRPASVETLFFKTPKGKGPLAGTCSVRAPQPPLVFAATHHGWYVWALLDDARPGPQSRLAHAPYFNVWENGEICTGNVELPGKLGPETTVEFERAFFGSHFTHPNHDHLSVTDTAALWADLNDGAETFPTNELIPAGLSLDVAIHNIIKGIKR